MTRDPSLGSGKNRLREFDETGGGAAPGAAAAATATADGSGRAGAAAGAAQAWPAEGAPRTLDDLARLGPRELMVLYRTARTPKVEDLSGRLRGRMLAVPAIHGLPVLPALVDLYAGSFIFPWNGKSFRSRGDDRGEGVNRVLFGRFEWFRFETAVGPSRAGPFDAVELDYDRPGNPWLIRQIRDEVREVAPNLFLGLAYARILGSFRLAVFFALARR